MPPWKEDLTQCEICRDDAEISALADAFEIRCGRCGRYRLSGTARTLLQEGEWRDKAWVLACVTRNAWVSWHRPLYLTTDNIPSLIADAPIATSPMDVIDRLISDLAYTERSDGGFAGSYTIAYDKHVLYYLPSSDDLEYVLKCMQAAGYGTGFSKSVERRVFQIELSLSGWQRAAELERADYSQSVFARRCELSFARSTASARMQLRNKRPPRVGRYPIATL